MTATRLTLEQFLALPDTEPASEFVCGEVVQKPMPDEPHGLIQLFLGSLLLQFVRAARVGRVATEWHCVFGRPGAMRGYVPDIVYVSHQRAPRMDARQRRLLRVAPDIAVEVLSPDQNADEFARKIAFYRANGVRLTWVVNPDRETFVVYRPEGEETLLRVGDTLTGEDVLPGFAADVADIFAQLIS